VTIKDSKFEDILGGVAQLYRGGTDESTFGPHFTLEGSELNNAGNQKAGVASVYLHGVQVTDVHGNSFSNSAPIVVEHTVGDPITSITDNEFANTPEIEVSEFHFGGEHTATLENNRYEND
jgi:poly(beta-D-mannuronate) lyase